MWQKWWKTRMENFHEQKSRRALASAISRWRLGLFACRSRCPEAIHIHRSRLLRKCLLALADNAHFASIVRRLLESCRRRALREGLEGWRRWLLLVPRKKEKVPEVEEAKVNDTTRRHKCRRPGQPRKAHCRCVYAVGRERPCGCAPRSHLLRRVEELHRLVAKGLDGRDGGYRLLSHVVQRESATRARSDRSLPAWSYKQETLPVTEGPESCLEVAAGDTTGSTGQHASVGHGRISALASAKGPRY